MAYQKQTFIDMETIATAEQMNHIEDGIVQNESDIATNAADIKTNKNNITTLTSDLATQEKTVQQNASDISEINSALDTTNKNVSQNTSDISSLNSALADLLLVERIYASDYTVASGSQATIDTTLTVPNGYKAIGTAGFSTGNAQVPAFYCAVINDGETARIAGRNMGSSSLTISAWCDVIFFKN